MASVVPASVLNQLKATNGKSITCKAAVAWEPKTPLDITDIQVGYLVILHSIYFVTVSS